MRCATGRITMETISTPVRLQLRRTKGFKLISPNGLPIVKVDRSTKWGNPFVVGRDNPMLPGRKIENRRHAWSFYLGMAPQNVRLVEAARAELQGKNLACWCPLPEAYEHDCCHAAVLLKIANNWPLIEVK
jgi:hypothetical protein